MGGSLALLLLAVLPQESWTDLRSAWEEAGVLIEGSWVLDVSTPFSGGVRHRTTGQGVFDLGLGLDLETFAGWEGASVYGDLQWKHGRLANDDIGDWQGTSNIDTESYEQVAELYYEQWLGEQWRLKLGKVDAWQEWAVVENAAEFLNNGPGYPPTLFVMPGYPDPAFSVNLWAYPDEASWLGFGVFDGALQEGVATGEHGAKTFLGEPADLFLIAEAGHRWDRGRAALGGWRHTGSFDEWDGGETDATGGLYAILDQTLWREAPELPDDVQGLSLFVQSSAADEDVTEIARAAAAGLAWTGPFEGRDEDVLGLAAAFAEFSDESGAGFTENGELALEVFYRWQLTPWLALKPDLQFIKDPGGDEGLEDTIVGSLRFEFAF